MLNFPLHKNNAPKILQFNTFQKKLLFYKFFFYISQGYKTVLSTRYKLTYSSVPSSNDFALFLFEKQYALIYQVEASRFFGATNNRKYLKIDI